MSTHHAPTARDLLIAEVLHLHALWHRGPPPRPGSPLLPANPPAFKKQSAAKITKKQIKKKNKKEEEEEQQQQSNPPAAPAAEKEWPCPPTPIPTTTDTSGWNPFPLPYAVPSLRLPSVEEVARAAAAKVQVSAIKSCEEFFSGGDDDIGEEDEDEDEDEGSAMDEDGDGSKIGPFDFFMGLFEKDGELRGYYEKNCEDGYFSCLVCLGTGAKKKGKRFRNCVGLVQHANAIFKTKRKGAHRGFARAVCRVLGWNMERLPSIVLDLADPLGKSLIKADGTKEAVKEVGPQEVANKQENCGEDLMESVPKSENDPLLMEVVEEECSKEVAGMVEVRGETMVKSVEQSKPNPLSMGVVQEVFPKKVPDSVEDRGENSIQSIEQTEANPLLTKLLEEERFKEAADVVEVGNLIKSAEQSEANQLLVEKDLTEDVDNLPKESAKLALANTDNIAIKEPVVDSPNIELQKNVLIGEKVDVIMEGGGNVEPNNGT